jgi:hypothetical protein
MNRRFALVGLACAALIGLDGMVVAQSSPYKGLQITPKSLERATRVSLQDCPPGENIVRGVIRPNEDNEFASIQIDVKVSSSYEPAELAKPVVYDDAGNAYKTAQSFRGLSKEASYTCNFSFRVPKGTKLARFTIEDVSINISKLEE